MRERNALHPHSSTVAHTIILLHLPLRPLFLPNRLKRVDKLAWVGELACLKLRVKHMPVVNNLERVDRPQSLGYKIEPVQSATVICKICQGVPHKFEGRDAESTKNLFSED